MKKTSLYFVGILALLLLVTLSVSTHVHRVSAQAVISGNLTGWGWSDNIGWISFSCVTGGSVGQNICDTSNYGISEDSSGNLTGYAWSDSVGWIQFGTPPGATSLAPFPSGGGSATNAKVNSVDGTLTGWVQALAGRGRTDGWDGWISLSGIALDNSPYGLQLDLTKGLYAGYGWGSDVIGWLAFNTTGTPTSPCDPTKGQVCFNPGGLTPSITLSVSPTSLNSTSATALLSWTTANVTTCSFSGDLVLGSSSVATTSTPNTHTVGPFPTLAIGAHTFSYTLTCAVSSQAGGGTLSSTTTLPVTIAGVVPPGPGTSSACTPILNALLCPNEGTAASGLSPSAVVGSSTSCTATPASPPAAPSTLCEFYCMTGFTKLGKSCVLNSTVQEK